MKYYQVFISAEIRPQGLYILKHLLSKRLAFGGPVLNGPSMFLWKGELGKPLVHDTAHANSSSGEPRPVEECRFPRASRGDRLKFFKVAAEQICSRLGSSELSQIFPEYPQDLATTSPRRPKMFARNVRLQLKPNSTKQFTETLEKEVLPVLRKQEGFQDEVAFIVPGGTEAVEISFWQSKENAEAYSRAGYPEELKALGKVVEGTPQLQVYEVSNSTFHKIAARA